MRVILDFNDNLFLQMKVIADIKEKSVDKMLSDLFVHYLLNPTKHVERNNVDSIEDFRFKVAEQIHQLLPHITDSKMLPVLKHLRDDLSDDSFILTELHKKYKATRHE